jgi:uncharacterized protein involved in exopolysaccharide biosynthesis
MNSTEPAPSAWYPKKTLNPIILVVAGALVGSAATLLMKVGSK